jgi:hypothetical protein
MPARRLMRVQAPLVPAPESMWPLSIHSSGRYLIDAQGAPFFFLGCAGWSSGSNLTASEIGTYLDDRAAKGFTAIMVEAISREYTDQTPAYRNANGDDPFNPMTDFASPVTAYWDHITYLVDQAKARDLLVVMNPCLFGFGGGGQGWYTEMNAESDADLYAYGQYLGNRFDQDNILWFWLGDYDGDSTSRTKQKQIYLGIESVRTTALHSGHPAPDKLLTDVISTTFFSRLVNWIYCYQGNVEWVWEMTARAYALDPPIPGVLMEGNYENESGSAATYRQLTYQSMLSGACGAFFGNNPVWKFATGWETALGSTGAVEQSYAAALFTAFQWWKLVPKPDATLVTSSLGSGATRICPALASDGTFALIYVGSSTTVTIDKSEFTPGNIRIRLYDPTAGTYSTHTASTANTGTIDVATGGERIIVVDAA